MGIYDRDYMRVDRGIPPARRPRAVRASRRRRPFARTAGVEARGACTALRALLALQIVGLLIPTIGVDATGAWTFAWIDAFGRAGFSWDVPGSLLILPGATLLAWAACRMLGGGRIPGVALAVLGLVPLALVLRTPGASAWVQSSLEGLLWPGGGGWFEFLAIGCACTAVALHEEGLDHGGLSRLPAVLCALFCLAFLSPSFWRPIGAEPWTDLLSRIAEVPVVDDGTRLFVGYDLAAPQGGVPFAWVRKAVRGALWLAAAANVLAVLLLGLAAAAATFWRPAARHVATALRAVSIASAAALASLLAWEWSNPLLSLGDALIDGIDTLQALLTLAGTLGLAFVGLGAFSADRPVSAPRPPVAVACGAAARASAATVLVIGAYAVVTADGSSWSAAGERLVAIAAGAIERAAAAVGR